MGVHVLVDDVNEFAPQWNIQRNKEDEDEATASEHTLATNVAIEEGQLLEEVTHHIPSRVVLSYVHITTMFFNILPYKERNFYSSKYFFFQVIRVDASDEDCSPHYGDICGYEIESQGQPFSISKEGKYTAN